MNNLLPSKLVFRAWCLSICVFFKLPQIFLMGSQGLQTIFVKPTLMQDAPGSNTKDPLVPNSWSLYSLLCPSLDSTNHRCSCCWCLYWVCTDFLVTILNNKGLLQSMYIELGIMSNPEMTFKYTRGCLEGCLGYANIMPFYISDLKIEYISIF